MTSTAPRTAYINARLLDPASGLDTTGAILVEGTPAEISADQRVREVYLGSAHHG